jgi:hypothetical protein
MLTSPLLAVVFTAGAAIPSFSAPRGPGQGEPSHVPGELIVLLDHGPAAPTPEAVVESAHARRPMPGATAIGNPIAARFVISERARGAARERTIEDPEHPAAVLQRYVVLTYPSVVDLDQVAAALEMHPDVVWVGKNTLMGLSVTEPNDPFFNDNPGGVLRPPEQHQWGSYSLRLHEAWDWARGHAYMGIVDTGIDVDHPDFRPFDASGNFLGGNYRAHFSRDYGYDEDNVDEGQTQNGLAVVRAGHGTHVSGIVAATPNNLKGVAGACWNCSLMVSKASRLTQSTPGYPNGYNILTSTVDVVEGIDGAIDRGAQVLNLSLGYRPGQFPNCATTPSDPFCKVLDLMERRDVVMAAAAGNDNGQTSDWPASDSRVIGVGGTRPNGTLWPGSNVHPNQLMAPAELVLSTFYEGLPYAPGGGCNDGDDGVVDGYGLCTGTSMASPYIAGSVGILRSVNPHLTKANIEQILVANLQPNPAGWDATKGRGRPNVRAATQAALGKVSGLVLKNRLTPLFSMYSSRAEDYYYTTVPQMGSVAYWDYPGYFNVGPWVPGYGIFPDTQCRISPCLPSPGASAYIFTTFRSPNASPLVPLYRLSFKGTFPGGPTNPDNHDHTYVISSAEVKTFVSWGYRLDGIEGYIYGRCSPEPSCIPAGAVRLYRIYNSARDDWAIVPESEVPTYQANGYTMQYGSIAWIGYVYPNVDSDGDWLINGFESLVGTNPSAADSDCDGKTDGAELLKYPYSDPKIGFC